MQCANTYTPHLAIHTHTHTHTHARAHTTHALTHVLQSQHTQCPPVLACIVCRGRAVVLCGDAGETGGHRCTRPHCGFHEGVMEVQLRQRCARCHGSYYCSTGCQLMDWPRHMHECGVPGAAAAATAQ